jgi:hypothetical protein
MPNLGSIRGRMFGNRFTVVFSENYVFDRYCGGVGFINNFSNVAIKFEGN